MRGRDGLAECPICMEEVSELKELPCGHRLCGGCVERLGPKKQGAEAASGRASESAAPGSPDAESGLSCPHCRAKSPSESPGVLRSHFFGCVKCGLCAEEKESEDVWWCSDCSTLLCSRCGLAQHAPLGHRALAPFHSQRPLEEAYAYLKASAKRTLAQKQGELRQALEAYFAHVTDEILDSHYARNAAQIPEVALYKRLKSAYSLKGNLRWYFHKEAEGGGESEAGAFGPQGEASSSTAESEEVKEKYRSLAQVGLRLAKQELEPPSPSTIKKPSGETDVVSLVSQWAPGKLASELLGRLGLSSSSPPCGRLGQSRLSPLSESECDCFGCVEHLACLPSLDRDATKLCAKNSVVAAYDGRRAVLVEAETGRRLIQASLAGPDERLLNLFPLGGVGSVGLFQKTKHHKLLRVFDGAASLRCANIPALEEEEGEVLLADLGGDKVFVAKRGSRLVWAYETSDLACEKLRANRKIDAHVAVHGLAAGDNCLALYFQQAEGPHFVMLYILVGKSLVETNNVTLNADQPLLGLFLTPSPHKVVILTAERLVIRGIFGGSLRRSERSWDEEAGAPDPAAPLALDFVAEPQAQLRAYSLHATARPTSIKRAALPLHKGLEARLTTIHFAS